ncbi:MAG: hypothetical protein KGY41_06325, partial [Desulfovermiculus sp.]|nr:hypothetical protein [Desulfovermiculus sp.]
LLGEVLNVWGFLGVLFIAAGGYVLSIALAKSAYMLAVKRLNTLISVIYGGLVFQEKNMAIRLCGTLQAQNIFGGAFNERLLREQMCYFDDIDYTEVVDFLLPAPPSEEDIKSFLIQVATS